MVAVDVRDQDRVDPADFARHRDAPAEMPQPRAQQRIRQQARTAQLDQHARMPEPP